MLSSHLRLGLLSGLLPSGLPQQQQQQQQNTPVLKVIEAFGLCQAHVGRLKLIVGRGSAGKITAVY
jgi:hypothetical protein